MYRLVIIDDEYFTLEGMKQIIDWEECGIKITGTASDGTEGLELIREQGADIVIADIKMQEMDGLEMIEELRKDGFDGKIIILSGYQLFTHAQRAIEYKVEKYLTKPVNPKELLKTIKKIVKDLDDEREKEKEPAETKPPEILEKVLSCIEDNFTGDVRLSSLAEQYYCSVTYLSKLFKKYVGMNFIDYITKKRIEKAKELLYHTDMPIDEIIWTVGYQDAKHFRDVFRKSEGISPSEFRRNCKTQK